MTLRLDATPWPDVAAAAGTCLLVIPIGSTEQHGPHLPFTTDTEVAVALSDDLASRWGDAVVAPALPYSSAGEHGAFAGTLSLGAPVFEQAVIELVRSADAFLGIVLVSAHGGNHEPLSAAVGALTGEGRRVLAWSPAVRGGDAHAGRTETSMMLGIRPRAVALDRAEPGDTRPIAALLPSLRAGGVASVSANGVLGDPTGANAAEGSALLAALGDDLFAAVKEWAR